MAVRRDRVSTVAFACAAVIAAVCLPFGIVHPLVGDWSPPERDR